MTFVLRVNLIPENDPPVVTVNGTRLGLLYDNSSLWQVGVANTTENSPLNIGRYFQIEDPDFNPDNIIGDFGGPTDSPHGLADIASAFIPDSVFNSELFFMSFRVENGVISLSEVDNLVFLTDPSDVVRIMNGEGLAGIKQDSPNVRRGRKEVSFVGQYGDVLRAAASAVYRPDLDWFGIDLFSVTVNDLGTDGSGQLTRRILIDVQFVDTGPFLSSVPDGGTLQAVEDVRGVIGTDCCGWLASSPSSASAGHADSYRLDDGVMNLSVRSFQVGNRNNLLKPRTSRII
eukprot:gene32866-38037_t